VLIPSTDENRTDMFGAGSPPRARPRSRPTSRGDVERAKRTSLNLKGKSRDTTSSVSSQTTATWTQPPSSLLASSPPATPSASNRAWSDGRTTPSGGGSDAWEDTSDAGEDGDESGDVADELDDGEEHTIQSGRALNALLEAARPRRPRPDVLADVPPNWPSTDESVVYSSEPHRRPVPPVSIK